MVFPPVCSNCLGEASRQWSVSHPWNSRSAEVPICEPCRIVLKRRRWYLALIIMVPTILLMGLMWIPLLPVRTASLSASAWQIICALYFGRKATQGYYTTARFRGTNLAFCNPAYQKLFDDLNPSTLT